MADVAHYAYHQKFSKAEVNYEHPARGEHKCSECVHFEVIRPNGCEIVRGLILPGDWCNKWKAK